MTFSKPAALLLLGALAATAAHASETYTYDSNPILGFGGGPGVEFKFSFTVPAPLADGVYDFTDASQLPAGFSYVISDGFLTLSALDDLFVPVGPQFTIAGGQVTSYAFYALDLEGGQSPVFDYPLFYAAKLTGQTQDNVQLVDPVNPNIVGYDYTDAGGVEHVPEANRGPDDASGFWTSTSITGSVPENGSLVLMSLGSVLLLALSRRKQAR